MACERYREALTERAAGAPAAAGLDAHLAGCEGCRQELAALRRVLDTADVELRELQTAEPSPALAARIRQAASELEIGAGWRPAFLLQALAAVALLAAVVLVRLRDGEPSPTPAAGAPRPPLTVGAALSAPPARLAPPVPTVAPPRRPLQTGAPSAAAARRAAPAEPKVLVPLGELEALQRLAVLMNRERVASPLLAAVEQGSPDLVVPPPIEVRSVDITPLEIVPLDAAEATGTDTEGERR